MIFVTIGTQDKEFPRLLKAVENLNIDDEIIMQAGSTKFSTSKSNIKVYDYLNFEEYEKCMKDANIIICHAGVGTIIQGLKLHKKMIVAARLSKYKEHVNDHQLQILKSFSENGYIIALDDFDKLEEYIKMDFTPKEFISNNEIFNKKLYEKIYGENK